MISHIKSLVNTAVMNPLCHHHYCILHDTNPEYYLLAFLFSRLVFPSALSPLSNAAPEYQWKVYTGQQYNYYIGR